MASKRKARPARKALVFALDDKPGSSLEAARMLLAFAAPEIRELGSRPAQRRVQDTFLWAQFAWEQGLQPQAERAEMLGSLARQLGSELADHVAELIERRRTAFAASTVRIGPLRLEKHSDGFLLHVDAVDAAAAVLR